MFPNAKLTTEIFYTTIASLYNKLVFRQNRFNKNNSDISDLNVIINKLNNLKYAILANGKSNNELTQILHKIETEITTQKDGVIELENVIANSMDISNEMMKIEKKLENTRFDKEHIFFKEYLEFFNLTSPEGKYIRFFTESENKITRLVK